MKRVFVFQDFKSQKFWSVVVVGTDITVNYGKLGTDGQTQVKNYATTEEAEKAASKLIAEKTRKNDESGSWGRDTDRQRAYTVRQCT